MNKDWKEGYLAAMQDCFNLVQDEILILNAQKKYEEEDIMQDLQNKIIELRDSMRNK